MKTYICGLMLFVCTFLPALEEKIVLGTDDGWNSIQESRQISIVQGKHNQMDLILEDMQKQPDESTDLVLDFNSFPIEDLSRNYRVESESSVFSNNFTFRGNGVGMFQQSKGGLKLQPSRHALFTQDNQWSDFTIQFWLYPAVLQEGETILLWQGNLVSSKGVLPQEIRAYVEQRTIIWKFSNIFTALDGSPHEVVMQGKDQLIPRTWQHHMLRYNSETGLLEYLIDGIPEDITHSTQTRHEGGAVFLPYIGKGSSTPLELGSQFTGFIDEFSISKDADKSPQIERYHDNPGTVITKPLLLSQLYSTISRIEMDSMQPGSSLIRLYYRMGTNPYDLSQNEWKLYTEESKPDGRYIQLKIMLFSDGTRALTPKVSNITIYFESDLAPSATSRIEAVSKDSAITLKWRPVPEPDIEGYMIFIGLEPNTYQGHLSQNIMSPMDVGNVTEYTIEGLENGRLYYISIAAYDKNRDITLGDFSTELSIRPMRNE